MTDEKDQHSQQDPPKRWKRRFVRENEIPTAALSWQTLGQKAKGLDIWRVEVGKHFSESPRVLRVAWSLEWLFNREGYAFATDGYLSRKLAIPVNKIQSSLTELERAGAIIRASVFVKNKAQRRIWASWIILGKIPPAMGGIHTPRDGSIEAPHDGGREYLSRSPTRQFGRFSTTQTEARKAAELRDRAAARPRRGAPDSD
jgi:hypothetical protein